jgi:hypothetical protein
LISKQIKLFTNILLLRRKYPLDKFNKKYYLIWFSGRLHLFDKDTMLRHHVHPYETAQDLSFTGTGISVNTDINDTKEVHITDKHKVTISSFKQSHVINTRA